MKTKEQKPLTVLSDPNKVKDHIWKLEIQLKTLNKGTEDCDTPGLYAQRARIKEKLNTLYRLRKKQKNYTPPPKRKPNLKKGL